MEGPQSTSPLTTDTDRLESWKEIAAYLGRGITTVQRWEQSECLPVHRLTHAKKGSVFAFKHEVDAWRTSRSKAAADMRSTRNVRWALVCAVGALVALPIGVSIDRAWGPQRARASAAVAFTSRPLAADRASETAPSLSPDGELVVYSWRRDQSPGLYVKPVAGGAARPVQFDNPTAFGGASYPKWSPRGDLIAFLVRDGLELTRWRLYVVSAAGGSPRFLTSISGIGLCWTPDGSSLAFADRNATGEPLSIFSMSVEGGRRERVTSPQPGVFGDTQCAFSPEGRRLAFSRYSSRGQSDLYIQTLTTGASAHVERLTYGLEGMTGLDWTPDGGTIVFGSEAGLLEIPAASNEEHSPTSLTGPGGRALSPSFSRSRPGRAIRFTYEHNVRDVNVWRWSAAGDSGNHVTALRESSTWWEDSPAISSDGTHIAFSSNRTGTSEIWTAAADGANARQLTFYGGPIVVQAQFSPDGRRVAYSSQTGANRDIYVAEVDGSTPKRLTWEPSQEEYPSWSRDGRSIYFSSDRGGVSQIWRVAADGGRAVRVTTSQATQAFESSDGRLLYFVRGPDVPGLWSVPLAGGAEIFESADVAEAYWGVADTGVAFLVASPAVSPGGPTIRFFDFASKSVTTLATLSVMPNRVLFGFAVARDARSVLWTQLDRTESDVMVVDRWQR